MSIMTRNASPHPVLRTSLSRKGRGNLEKIPSPPVGRERVGVRGVHAFSVFMTIVTFFLVIAGGLVTSTGSGLAVPDWPLSYGQLMPPMVGGVFYEHGHRMVAATVGFLTVIQAIWLQLREPKRWLRILG